MNMMDLSPPRAMYECGGFLEVKSATAEYSILAAFVGAECAARSSYVMISARWLNVGTEAGVILGFVISASLLFLSLILAIGKAALPVRSIFKARTVRWVLLYLSVAGCSLLWSESAAVGSSAFYWCSLVTDVVTVLILCHGFGAECAMTSLMKGFIAATSLLAVIVWIMPATEDLRLGDVDYFNTNQIANLCALALLMCSLLAIRGMRPRSALSLLLGLTLCRSLSKATIIAFVLCLVYRLTHDKEMSRKSRWLLILGAAAAALIFFSLWEAYFTLYTATGNQAQTLTGRTAIWAWAFDAALSHPWIGNGFDAMWNVAPLFGAGMFEARHAENELLQQFFAYGACGVVLLIGIYGGIFRQFRSMKNTAERTALMAFLVYVLVRGLAEAEPFDLLLPLWLITGLSILTHCKANAASQSRLLSSPVGHLPMRACEEQ